ncbi:MAG TPA: hypothetical protein DCQ41_01015 [Cryomorphaceae bacterium]|nr:hypothetical protein [Cryomorphaceae bacterium]
MKTKDFDIAFIGLSNGAHVFEFNLDDSFFELFKYDEYSQLRGKVTMEMVKSETVLDLSLNFSGSIQAPCDVTNEPFEQALNNAFGIQVNFGDSYNDENEELLVLPHGEHQFNIAQMVYELVVLSIPAKLYGPNAGNGIEDYLKNEDEETETDTDPRWDQLKDLLNK